MIHRDLLWTGSLAKSTFISPPTVRKESNDLSKQHTEDGMKERYLKVDRGLVDDLVSVGMTRPLAIYIAVCDIPGCTYRIVCHEIHIKGKNRMEVLGPYEDLKKAITAYKAAKWFDFLDRKGRRLMCIERSLDQGLSWPDVVYQDDDSK